MQRLSDLVLFGRRLAITVGTETARRLPNLVAGSYRIVSALLGDRLQKSDGAGVASATPEVTPAAEPELAVAESKPPVAAAEPALPEVVPNPGGWRPLPGTVGQGTGDRSGDPSPPLVNDGRGPPILVSRTEAVA